ncbi:Txe/YoeB family addiction module toxin [Pseudomonas cichorii]|uniref:Txe/YoeB family addiction module toxin n=1 Tax=Pseudomonas cichorii TaxID=36746 RepID=UPI001C891D73|nr:Txe/YoeB family addiction module toxin [Pseudomonas cichorii]MBX8513772.1 Txe/YoeB family addiction module toxin [Pseudomonas cichorii]
MSQKKKQNNKAKAREAVNVSFTAHAWDDYQFWRESTVIEDQAIFGTINELISEIRRTPFTGTGKPEPLKANLSGFWSRRITREHRLVYLFEGGILTIIACRFHYD